MDRILSNIRTLQTPVLLIVLLAIVSGLASLTGSDAMATTIAEMMIRVVVVVGLYVFIGNSGIISFGHISFMCIGAYAAAWMTAAPTFKQIMLGGLPAWLQTEQYPFLVAMAFAAVLPAIVGLALGGAITRLGGIACSIATFAFLMITNSVYANWDSVTAGVSSIIGIPTLVGPWVAWVFAGVAILAAWFYQISRHGLMLRATRDDPVAAQASGINLVKARLGAFVLSAALVGLGGGLYAQFLGILTVDPFYLGLTFITLAMLVVGGMSSLTGAVIGVIGVTIIVELLRMFERGSMGPITLPPGSQELGLGILMALILVLRPTGLSGGRELKLFGRSRPAAPAAPEAAQAAPAE
ncbi:branched-chain amino acid ABC transporter permease [Albimonas pacifica]|uniref:Amino acid/amide ABC transporter membrane protein 2, HAAT family n=1 Tax=Albimonas pacifica TaxID=1114924 RepID=A0A1I3CLS6_9RHOB|nr:branched-chain amino acid ABC transporter permease [Albimonas pacifica]SFH75283.1 amino acid/amide ABC transporter membrane protein 2, HAAT family [Albimonas pacifica]